MGHGGIRVNCVIRNSLLYRFDNRCEVKEHGGMNVNCGS